METKRKSKAIPVRLGQKVFLLYRNKHMNDWIEQTTVYMRNNEAFLAPTILDDGLIDECRIEFRYEDYGKTWFKSLKEAKEYLNKTIGTNYKLQKLTFTDCIQYDIYEKESR